MISNYLQHTILLPNNSMHKTIMLFSLFTTITIISDKPSNHAYCNAAMQTQKSVIEDFVSKNLQVRPRLRRSRCVETTFMVKDFQRIGSTGFSEMRVIDTSSPNTSHNSITPFPRSEIHGWKIVSPNATNNSKPLSLTSYIPIAYKPRKGTIEVEAHFIIPKTDAPEEGIKEYIKLGFGVEFTQEGQPIGEDGLLFITSKDVLIPDKSSFNDAKATHISVTIRIKHNAQPKDLFRILFNRVPVSENKTEFDHKQGIALNALTIRYPI